MGEFARGLREHNAPPERISSRWIVNAFLSSLAFAVFLFLCFFLATVIANGMYSGASGGRAYTDEHKPTITFWYLISVLLGIVLIFLFCYSRRRRYHLEG